MSALVLASGVSFGTQNFVPAKVERKFQIPSNMTMCPVQAPVGEAQPTNAPAYEGEDVSIDFGYSQEVYNAMRFNDVDAGSYIYMAFEIPASDAAAFAGAKITGVNITSGSNGSGQTNPVTDVEVFVSEELNAMPSNFQASKISSIAMRSKFISLETPYEIKGDKAIYIGYRFQLPTNEAIFSDFYYLPVDGIPTDANTYLCAVQSSETDTPEFFNYSDQIGSLPISVRITNLRENVGLLNGIRMDRYFKTGDAASYEISIYNMGRNNISSVDTKTTISNGTVFEKTVNLSSPITPGKTGVVTVTDVPNDAAEGIFLVTSEVTKYNGEEALLKAKQSVPYYTYTEGFTRIPVIEEGTGTWCGWCPRGIVMMEYLKKNYPDWIRIAVHSGDQMEISAYKGFLQYYISGFPGAVTNRLYLTDPAGEDDRAYKPIYDYFKSYPAYCNLKLSATPNANKTSLEVSATSEFSIDTDVEHLLSFVIVEDGLGPYDQTNYYSGGSYGVMAGWEKKAKQEPTMYDDVPRVYKEFPGIKESIPAAIEKYQQYDYTLKMPLRDVKGTNYRLVGMITNGLTGEIVNACEIEIDEAGVENLAEGDEAIDIRVVEGDIIVTGAANVAVYTLDGRMVGTQDLGNGVYIVNADGVSKKVIVK